MEDLRANENVIQIIGGDDHDSSASNLPSIDYESIDIGRMFFKTQICPKFTSGTCQKTNCNYAHGVRELRVPPSNWQEIVNFHQQKDYSAHNYNHQEQFPVPLCESWVETERSDKARHCRKFYSESGCAFGNNCNLIHDHELKDRERVAIVLNPRSGGFNDEGPAAPPPPPPVAAAAPPPPPPPVAVAVAAPPPAAKPFSRPPNWRTRICQKWEYSGYCPFENRCLFAHGVAELQSFGANVVDRAAQNVVAAPGSSAARARPAAGSLVARAGAPHGLVVARAGGSDQPPGTVRNWKVPKKISGIYGDWID